MFTLQRRRTSISRRRVIIGASLSITIAAIAAGISDSPIARERRAIANLRNCGASVYHWTPGGPPLGNHPCVQYWRRYRSLLLGECADSDVHCVEFQMSPTPAQSLPQLADLPNLRKIVLNGPVVADDATEVLSRIRTLNSLTLTETSVTSVGLQNLSACGELETLTLAGPNVNDTVIHGLLAWPALKRIEVVHANLSSKALALIASIPTVRAVELMQAGTINDEAVLSLRSLADLELLDIGESPITDEAMHACQAWKSLRAIRINSPLITDVGVRNLAGLSGLQMVLLQNTAVHDCEVFARLPQLLQLDLSGTQIADSSVEQLSRSRSIAFLSLQGTAITDGSLHHLASLSTLRTLKLGPFVTESAARLLQSTLPRCAIRGLDENGEIMYSMQPQ